MPSSAVMIAFLATTAIFALMPGPAMLYTAAQTLARGRWSGLTAALGLHLGGYVHICAAAAGLSLLLKAVPVAYLIIKVAGAVYLIWLGIGLWRKPASGHAALPRIQPKSSRRVLVESIGVEILNPKTALFFLALLPQFIDASAAFPIWVQFVILGSIVNAMFSVMDVVCVVLAAAALRTLRRSARAQGLMRRAGGAAIVGLGVHLALQKA